MTAGSACQADLSIQRRDAGAIVPRPTYIPGMQGGLLLNVSALLALVPASALSVRRPRGPDGLFWLLLAVAVAGPAVAAVDDLARGWLGSLSAALWLTVVATLVMFIVISAVTREGWRLTPLLLPYLFLVGSGAALASHVPHSPLAASSESWIEIHILVSVTTYGLLTNAAIAGFAVFLQERALKRRQPGPLTSSLPAVADAERLQIQLLTASGVVLGVGLLTGVASQFAETGSLLELTHKTVLAFTAFLVIAVLLLVHHRTGLRGRRAARFVLLAYLLLTLAYPGVKFVTDVLLA